MLGRHVVTYLSVVEFLNFFFLVGRKVVPAALMTLADHMFVNREVKDTGVALAAHFLFLRHHSSFYTCT